MKRFPKIIAGFFILAFSFVSVCTPSVFAQTPASNSLDKAIRSREYMELLNGVFTFVLQRYVDEVDPEVLYKGAMNGILDSLGDIHTAYLEEAQQRDLADTTAGEFGGVGLSITKATVSTPENPAYVEVANPIEGTPGWRAGILAGDKLVEIDGTPTPDITMDDVLGLLRGEVGTEVEVKVRRGKAMEFTVVLERAIIEVPTVKFGMIEDGSSEKTGYLRIIEFTPLTPDRVQDALDVFAKEGYTSLIIDLRSNPGGLITSVEEVADKFIDDGVIVSTKGRTPADNSAYYASPEKTTFPSGIPIVILTDGGSASASEILAGALKDTKKAFIVGENTYGKGSVQIPIALPYNDGFKITIARYYSPSDSNIDKVGIPPDLKISLPVFTDEEQKAYINLVNDNIINEYVEEHQDMTEADISSYAETLKEKYALDPWLLRRLIRLQVNKTRGDPLYDLDYDIQLQSAIETARNPEIFTLIQNTKTLKEIELEKAEVTD